MTPDQLDTIEARANAATPGPWSVKEVFGRLLITCPEVGAGLIADLDRSEPLDPEDAADAALIANARTDIPALVARVRELEAARRELAAEYNRRDAMMATLLTERAEMQGYCDRLLADGRAVALELDELRATLANERGEGEGPSEGWTWDGNSCAWLHGIDTNGEYPDDGWTVEQTPAGQDLGWTWPRCRIRVRGLR